MAVKKILITGCNRGIGLSLIGRLIKKNLIYGISRSNSNLSKYHKYDNFKFYKCDIEDVDYLNVILDKIYQESNGIDVMINNAGIGIFDKIENISYNDWLKIITINLSAPFLIIKKFIPKMKSNQSGMIINITSDADSIGFPEGTAYCASKFGLNGLSEALRKELSCYNISVTTIAPGRVDTHFNNKKPGDRPLSLSPDIVAKQVENIINNSKYCEIQTIRLKSKLE